MFAGGNSTNSVSAIPQAFMNASCRVCAGQRRKSPVRVRGVTMHPDPARNTTMAKTKQQPVHEVRLEAELRGQDSLICS